MFEWWLLPAFRHVEAEQAPPSPSTTRRLPGSQKANGQGFGVALGGFGRLDTLPLVWQHAVRMDASENQFVLARAVPIKGRRVKKQIIISNTL
jgi:hypothetical protein